MLHIPDLHHLSFVLKKRDEYSSWANETVASFDAMQKISIGETTLYHQADAFDSHLFGYPVGKVEHVFGYEKKEIEEVVRQFMQVHPYEYVLVRISQDAILWIQAFEKVGALLLDTTVDLVAETSAGESDSAEKLSLRLSQPADLKSLQEIAHSYSHGRFFTDPDVTQGTDMYLQWVENSLNGKVADRVYILEDGHAVAGFVSIKITTLGSLKVWKVPLVGKHPSSQKPAVARLMLQEVLMHAKNDGTHVVLISTQGTNIAAQRAYITAGFSVYHSGVSMGWKKSRLA